MISILLNWMYIFFTTYAVGYAFSRFVEDRLQYRIRRIDSTAFIGIVIMTVYVQLFSLVYKVGLLANLIMLLACFIVYVKWYSEIISRWKEFLTGSSRAKIMLIFISIAVWCFCTSRGYMHYDSDLYHAQSIRWIEEYGIVKGLGNIHVRFAYNSSFFALSALYSMKFLTGHSLHTVNGFMALLLWLQVLPLFEINEIKQGKTLVTSFARLGAFYYLTVIYSDIVAPASDYAIMCVVFLIVIKWLELLEKEEDSAVPYALLCVAGVYAVTLKLTAGLILILLAKPVCMLIREKKWRDIGIYLVLGFVTIAPWFARTVVLSGYLLYPFPSLDLFDVDWKMDAAAAALDAAEIRTWGRGLNNAALIDLPVSEWFPGWFQGSLPVTGKLFVMADILCLLVFVILMVWMLCDVHRSERMQKEQILVLGTVLASYVFWQLSAPLLRYGYAYVLLVIMITVGILCDILIKYFDKWEKKDMIRRIAILMVLIFGVFSAVKLLSLVRYCCGEAGKQAYVWQQDYGSYELESYVVNGVTFYYPMNDDRTGYDCFPSVPKQIQINFRGQSIKDGFQSV